MRRRKRLQTVLVKPAGPDCNMHCSYCFYLDRAELFPASGAHRMSDEVLEETIRQACDQAHDEIHFAWQGGEPTLMGLPFFERAVNLQNRHRGTRRVANALQTNGILLDNSWGRFLRDQKFLVGLSLDGPQHVHDRYRRMSGGQGSWETVSHEARQLLEQGVAVNTLSLVTDYSVQFPEEILEFHRSLGLKFIQFIPCVEPDPVNSLQLAPFSVSPREYGQFLNVLFDLWIGTHVTGTRELHIRFFDSVFYSYVNQTPPDCTLAQECGTYVVVEHNGDVFACDFFVDRDWQLGNIMEGRLDDMLNSELQTHFGRIKSDLTDTCRRCRWQKHCRGGCSRDRLTNPGAKGLSYFCDSYRMFFEHADERLRSLADIWQRNRSGRTWNDRPRPAARSLRRKPARNELCPCGGGRKFKRCCGADIMI